MKVLDSIALLLMIIGGVNWGLISFFQFNLVSSLFGSFSSLTRIIYALVGIASVYSISFFAKERAS
ncbi:hypothetical protein CLOBY_13140 [Clostridium saccharobutylicum]|uniref:DUF378 domain-containing protein n=1 Tax=Clostridium saccharobutylicum TaxID=169679 RepID=UPI000983C0BC|nr:DUF378 domain-containing protein [Clostridium saccharobutylicum]AQS09191.1 hypothetical protein CLOBY_13140 [Clostridium saccharobutylicum]MBC2435309.1 DUF378 domain-containing protein [Clostridium saccharobutylicum]NSB87426.1 hypothetical protein [Clostridium saccharobutylicum]NYC28446.1 uncharacterized membrane protein YuzA (DUF378 family) [Clostridium saccharobutylicum]OOM15640.1 hypothetical protein CLSAB_24820 [Clostridium saccharobutylicum]